MGWHTQHCVPHCDQTPFRIVRVGPADAASFLKGADSLASCPQHPTHWREEGKKGQKNLSLDFAAFQSLYSLLGTASHILNSGSTTPPPSHQDCHEHPPTYNFVKSSSKSCLLSSLWGVIILSRRERQLVETSLIGKKSDILGGLRCRHYIGFFWGKSQTRRKNVAVHVCCTKAEYQSSSSSPLKSLPNF